MKYLLKQNKEDKGILCNKVTIDGFDYYVSDEKYAVGENCIGEDEGGLRIHKCVILNNCLAIGCKKVIATNNQSIDIPKVIDEVFKLAYKHRRAYQDSFDGMNECIMNDAIHQQKGFIEGYNKSQETHPFSEEDMIEFNEWIVNNWSPNGRNGCWDSIELNSKNEPKYLVDSTKELLQIWKSSQPKIVYYND